MQKLRAEIQYFLLFIASFFALIVQNISAWPKINMWHLPDSDDVAKVLEVRAWLSGQGFYDMFNHRSNPPFGGEMHWSRLAEMPLALMEIILKPIFGQELGEKYAIFITPLILGAIFIVIATAIVQNLSKKPISFLVTPIIIITCSNILFSFWPGRVDHHGLQLICLFLLIYGLINNNKKGGAAAGFALAASLTIGFEALPLQTLIMLWVILIWLLGGKERLVQLTHFCFALAIGIVIGFLINVAPEDFANAANDRLSIAQTLPILFGAISFGIIIGKFSNAKIITKLGFLIAIGIGVLLIGAQFPILLKPLYWQVTPLLNRLWLADVGETFPIYKFPIGLQIAIIAFPALSLLAFIIKFAHDIKAKTYLNLRIDFENWALLGALLLFSCLLICFFQIRLAGQATAMALLLSAAIISILFKKENLIYGLLAALVLNPILPNFLEKLATKITAPKAGRLTFGEVVKCRAMPHFEHLAAQPKGLVLTNINMGAETLLMTHHDVLTTHFHRDMGKIKAYDILLSSPEIAFEKLKAAKIDYIAFCNRAPEIGNLARENPNGLMAKIIAPNELPEYLVEIKPKQKTDIYAYKVIK